MSIIIEVDRALISARKFGPGFGLLVEGEGKQAIAEAQARGAPLGLVGTWTAILEAAIKPDLLSWSGIASPEAGREVFYQAARWAPEGQPLPSDAPLFAAEAERHAIDAAKEAARHVGSVVGEVGASAAAASPWWVWVGAALGTAAAIAYIVRTFR